MPWHFPLTDPFLNVGDGGGIPINDLGFPDIGAQVAPPTTGCFTYTAGGFDLGVNPYLYSNPCFEGFNPENQPKGTGGGIPIGALPSPPRGASPIGSSSISSGSIFPARGGASPAPSSGSNLLILAGLVVLFLVILD